MHTLLLSKRLTQQSKYDRDESVEHSDLLESFVFQILLELWGQLCMLHVHVHVGEITKPQ